MITTKSNDWTLNYYFFFFTTSFYGLNKSFRGQDFFSLDKGVFSLFAHAKISRDVW